MKYAGKIVQLIVLLSLTAIIASAQRLHPAEEMKSARTVASSYRTAIEFRNETNKTVKLFWLDEEGKRKFAVTLAPKQSKEYDTYLSQPWLVTDERDNALSLYYPDAQRRIIYLRDNDLEVSERDDEDDYRPRPERDYKAINICANQEIPRGFLITSAGNEWNCPNWTATGKNSYTIKRPSPTEPTKVCGNQKIPRSFVITAASSEWGCPNWTATGKKRLHDNTTERRTNNVCRFGSSPRICNCFNLQ